MNGTVSLIAFLYGSTAFSQPEVSKWYFGHKGALDFSNGTPVAINTSSMATIEGCASIADASGNLLFYTDGFNIWNKANTIMANGTGLTGHQSSAQSALIIKKSASTNLYYVFTVGHQGNGTLAYSLVDMSLAAGMGSVTVKNVTLAAQMTEKLAGTRHCNGTDSWVVAHRYNSNQFLAYHVSAGGVNTVPVVSAVGHIHAPSSGTLSADYLGCLKFSPNGKKLLSVVAAMTSGPVELFQFDGSMGVISQPLQLGLVRGGYGCEFSADGKKCYVTAADNVNIPTSELLQWDLCKFTDSLIIASRLQIDTVVGFLQTLQLGSDRKVYVARLGQDHQGVIHFPGVAGQGCGFQKLGPSLAPGFAESGLPNFESNFFRAKPVFQSSVSCASASFQFPDLCGSGYSVVSRSWLFGDPSSGSSNTSSLTNPSHLYAAAGSYTVNLVIQYNCGSDTLKQVVNINIPALSIAGTKTVCAGQVATFTAAGAQSYSWSTGQQGPTLSLTPTANATYTVTGTNTISGCSSSQTIGVVYSTCEYVSEEQHQHHVRLHPNPTDGNLNVEVGSEGLLKIFDQCGVVVFSEKLHRGANFLDLSRLVPGLYFAEISGANQRSLHKLVRE